MIQLHPAAERGTTRIGWLDSKHSFSFGYWYDPERLGFSQLRVLNDSAHLEALGEIDGAEPW